MFRVLLGLVCLGMSALAQGTQNPGPNASSCVVGPFTVTLPGYQATRETRGTLDIQVTCVRPTERYRLYLMGGQITSQGDAVYDRASLNGPRLEVLGAAPALNGQEWTGNQQLRFPLRIPAGQWGVSGGHYPGTLVVALQTVGE